METNTNKLMVPGAIIIAGVIISVGLYAGLSRGQNAGAQGGQPPQVAVNIKDVKIDGNPYIGQANAKPIAYWSDYQCPFCKQFELSTLPTIIQKYVDTGKIKIVFKDYAFLGSDSVTAALYEHAVWELYPNKFFEWRESMYKAQDEEGDQGFGDSESIDALTKKISGIDIAKVKALVSSKKDVYTKETQADQTEGASLGIGGTPAFVIGKQSLVGAQPLAEFEKAIDAALK